MRRSALIILLILLIMPASSEARPAQTGEAEISQIARVSYNGLETISYRYGPLKIEPGQNLIKINSTKLFPNRPGFITRFQPNLIYSDGTVPRVDVLHLHHGVWLVNGSPQFAAGEEKTILQLPQGFGWPTNPNDRWLVNDMIHNLLPSEDQVYLTWTIDFLPAEYAAGLRPVRTLWMDVAGLRAYPVFDANRSMGQKGRYTFPDQASGSEREKIGLAATFTADRDLTLVAAMGHLHPGGLHTDLKVNRGGDEKHLFRSEAVYFEPAGAVSWDTAMTVTKPDWRVAIRAGDKLSVSATYDVSRASWRESMGIMPLAVAEGDAGGKDPFLNPPDIEGPITHGHLAENRNHGGKSIGLKNPLRISDGPFGSQVAVRDFIYRPGDLNLTGRAGRPPSVRQGRSLEFVNYDPAAKVFHTITACKAPCNRSTGIAYPLADGPVDFDSGELGIGPAGFTAASGKTRWRTPKSLKPGTYTYFCRVHPFMRGAFRIKRR